MAGKKASTENEKVDKRARIWWFILYPESAPKDWKEIIDGWHIEAAASPLHDKDMDKDGKPKKPHHHILIKFDGSKSPSQVKELVVSVGGVMLERVHNTRSALRYLCHLDHDKKTKYNWEDVEVFGGLDLGKATGDGEITAEQRIRMLAEMSEFIDENRVLEYDDFETFCRTSNWEWFRLIATSGREHVRHKIASKRYKEERAPKNTGAKNNLKKEG
jgi:hypothetical protein